MMVEPAKEILNLRALTPTPIPSGYISDQQYRQLHPEQLGHLSSSPTPSSSPVISKSSRRPVTQSDFQTHTSRAPTHSLSPVMTDAHGDAEKSSSPVPNSPTAENQFSYPHFSTSSPNFITSPRSSGNAHSATPSNLSARPYYGRGGGYNPQIYTMPTQQAPAINHPSPFPTYPPTFHGQRATEGTVTSQNPQVRYQPILPPHVPVYYQPHPTTASIPTHFQPVHYQSSLPPSQFMYPPHSFPGSPPVYQPYPPHPPYGTSEADAQGGWYYLPHNARQRTDTSPIPTYQGHYPTPYPPIGPSTIEDENPNSASQGSGVYSWSASQGPTQYPDSTTGNRSHSTPMRESPALHVPSSFNTERGVAGDSTGNTASSTGRKQGKTVERKAYHPNPPPHRSEWVMWVGNIPSDATHDELQNFFNQPLASTTVEGPTSTRRPSADHQRGSGVTSIFPIPKSSCVFVNYQAEEYLTRAIETFNGRPLRPYDPRSLKLVCRVRKRDDDLKAGVGGQRGQGLHTKWIKDQRLKGKHAQSGMPVPVADLYSQASGVSAQDSVDQLTTHTSDLALSSDEEGKRRTRASHRSSSGSFTSTDSSFLSSFFPERYFILKSLTQYDLDLSVQHGVWATQKHNEGILDQAYRTSKDVFLIFGVNKSGEFYGYAKMAGPLQRGEKDILWASRTPRLPSRPGTSGPTIQATPSKLTENPAASKRFFNDNDDTSSESKTPGPRRDLNSAPAELGHPHNQSSPGGPIGTRSSTLPDSDFALDPQAPLRAIRTQAKSRPTAGPSLLMVDEEHEDDVGADDESRHGREDTWGDSFRVEWLCTERLSFHWTRNLRNPWNHDKEVKISRDGTELEPTVGQTLLNAWEVMRAAGGEIPSNPPTSGSTVRRGQHTRKQNPTGRTAGESAPKGPTRS